ncbi:MAG TPA: cytochrome c oxidase subunit 3 family protein [Pirellulales bacterium]|jgi:cytochrome c oxidase subunit 3
MTNKTASPWWHHFDSLEHQQETTTFGMWVFLATEVLIFGAIFTGYTVYRSTYTPSFEAASDRLNLLIGAVNTVVLLTSSLTMALAVHAAKLGQTRKVFFRLVLTAVLGLVFLGLKALEYYGDYRDELVPGLAFDPAQWTAPKVHAGQVQLFLVFYYCLTGLHAVHLTIGIIIVAILAWMTRRAAFNSRYYAPVEIWGLYWHFVDLIWIFLLPLLYLIGTRDRWL